MTLSPHVEGLNELEPPPGFLSEFESLTSGIYPQDIITKLRRGGYNPHVIGYVHDGSSFPKITERLKKIAASTSRQLKVVLEIVPEQLGWIKEFLRDEREYKEHGTVWGKKPTEDAAYWLQSYRPKLHQSHSQRLALWLLENGFRVISIEHKDVMQWINSDKGRMFGCDEEFWRDSGLSDPFQPGYTAIRRDIHGLGVIDKERPDIISVGLYHALKYDLLLGQDGKVSFYFISGGFSWSATLNMWREVHNLYSQQRTAAK